MPNSPSETDRPIAVPPTAYAAASADHTNTVDPPEPLRIAATYFLLGLAWIAVTGRGLVWAGGAEATVWASAGRGLLFVVVSSALIYWLIRRDFRRITRVNTLLRAVADGTTDAVFVKDLKGRYLLCNPATSRFAGMPISDILGKDDEELFEATSAARIRERDRKVMETGDVDTEEEVLTASGVTRTFLATKAPFRDADGKTIGLVGISRDITQYREADRTVRKLEERLRLALQGARGGAWDWDLSEDEAWWSDEMYELWGIEPGPAMRLENSTAVMLEPDREMVRAAAMETIATGKPFHAEFRIQHSKLGVRWMASHGQVLEAEPGRPRRLVGISFDITDRKRDEVAMRFQHALLRAEAEAAPEGILVVAPDARVLSFNNRFLEIWKIPRELATVAEDARVLSLACNRAADPAAFLLRVQQIYADVDASSHDEVLLADGRILDRHSGPIRGADGEHLGRVWYFNDVTGWRRAERLLSEQAQAASMRAAVAVAVSSPGDLQTILNECCETLVREVGVACARVWILHPTERMLERQASAGFAPMIDGGRTRIAVGEGKVGLVAQTRRPHVTDSVIDDPRVRDQAWASREGVVAFAGYPLLVEDRLVGVLAMFSRSEISPTLIETAGVAELIALCVDRRRSEDDRRRAEQAVRESEERYRRLIDVLPGAIFIHAQDKIVFCNPAFVRLMRAKQQEDLIGKSIFDVVHPTFHRFLQAEPSPNNERSGEFPAGEELRIVRLDGRDVPVYSVSTLIAGAGLNGVLTALSDLTERERSMNLLSSVLGSVTDAILTINAQGTVQSVNHAVERIFGYSEAEIIGGNVSKLMPEPYRSEHDNYIANYLRTGRGRVIDTGRELVGRRKDGTTFPLELTISEFRIDGERRFTGVVRDITARKRLEAQFQQAQKMEAVGQLAGGVAHDFNNLLTVINGYSDILLNELPEEDEKRDAVTAIQQSGERAARLTSQLLAFSRKAIVELTVLDLNELIADSTKLLRRLIGEHVTLTTELAPQVGRVTADRGQLEQVVMNLVVNGRDAMPDGGELRLETSDRVIDAGGWPEHPEVRLGRYAQLTVADHGLGMDGEVTAKIFEPFFTTKGVGHGTGLGLAVVHGVVLQSGGHIFVESTIGKGTVFTLLFPVAADSPAASSPPAASPSVRGSETLLLVEDEDAVRTIARMALEARGYQVLTASRGAEALRLLDEHAGEIDLLVTDVVMPEMSGRQLAQQVQASRPDLPVLYMSGYADDDMIHPGVLEPSANFLQKPFTPSGLAKKVRSVLDGAH